MAFLAPLIGTAIGALGGIFGNRGQTSNQSGTSNTQQQQQGSTLPVFSPQQEGLFNPLADAFLKQLSQGTSLSGFEAGQAQNIASNTDIAKRAAIENLASRGITTGAAPATALTGLDSSRIQQQSQLHQQIPLLQNQLFAQLLQGGTDLFGRLQGGTVTNNTSTQATQQQGQVTQPGNMLGGLFGNLDVGSIGKLLAALGIGGGGGADPWSQALGMPTFNNPFPTPTSGASSGVSLIT